MAVIESTVAKRVIFGALLIAVLLLLLFADAMVGSGRYVSLPDELRPVIFAALLAVLLVVGSVELYHIVSARGANVNGYLAGGFVAAVATEPVWGSYLAGTICKAGSVSTVGNTAIIGGVPVMIVLLFAFLLFAGLWQGVKLGTVGAIANLATGCLFVLYLGVGGSFLMKIRQLGAGSSTPSGQVLPVLMFLAVVKSTDIGAYFTGRLIGRHKWAPRISAGKTWEGFFGGAILAVIVSSLFAYYSGIISVVAAVVLGVVIATTGQLGDLLESMFKRDAGVKDSGALVPEFGGLLDMLDSPLVAAVFAYFIFVFYMR